MPRACINKKQYRMDTIGSWVVSQCFAKNVKRKVLANELDITPHGLNWKLHNNSFSFGDMLTIFEVFNCTDDEILQVMKIERG